MTIEFGCELTCEFPATTAAVLMLQLRPELQSRLLGSERLGFSPEITAEPFTDTFGNRGTRLVAPAGLVSITCAGAVEDSGRPAPIVFDAPQHEVAELPSDVLPYLLPSRYCDLEFMAGVAWSIAAVSRPGWPRVQAVCDAVHRRLAFDYARSRATRTASEAWAERTGVCRDFTHTAISLLRCLNIPARYVTGYLGEIGVPPDPAPMDFSAWMEVWLGEAWHVFDVRHNERRIGHLPIAWGRDAADVAFLTTFGPHTLRSFKVRTVEAAVAPITAAA